MSWLASTRTRLRLLFGRGATESRMDREIGFHIDMETERLVREVGLERGEARRRALVAFGGVEKHREALRDGRGLAWLGGLSLDLKLGGRMLVKYPGLTVVGGLAMAFAIWAGAVTFQMINLFAYPTLPLPDGNRIVQIENWDVEANDSEPRALYDFALWRNSLRSVTDLGAYRDVQRNLITDDGDGRLVDVAEITASAFRIDPTPPLFGRVLAPADELPGAQPVVVIGYDVWTTRFASDPDVVGRTVQIGDSHATVVGVMPEEFAFPVAHDLWTPLGLDQPNAAPREGPAISIFGRLAPGVSLNEAQAELTTVGLGLAAELPATHARLQPTVRPYTTLFGGDMSAQRTQTLPIYIFPIMLLVLVCGNVALLMFARAAAREAELATRSALGASRFRISVQLFAEALVLGVCAAALGLAAAHFGLNRWGNDFLETNIGRIPFWFDVSLSPATVIYAIGLTFLGAAIAGVLPALRVTRALGMRLRQASAGGGGLQFSGVWTAVIVTQVAFTVAFPSAVYLVHRELVRVETFEAGFPSEEYLGVFIEPELVIDGDEEPDAAAPQPGAAFGSALEALRGRVEAEAGVRGVTFVDYLPGDYHRETYIELDATVADSEPLAQANFPASQELLPEVATATVDRSYFEVLGATILAGRDFTSGDIGDVPLSAIVDEVFVDEVMLGRNPIGQRVRFARRVSADATEGSSPWFEIVGVVKELGMGAVQTHKPGLYLPDRLGSQPTHMIVHGPSDPISLAPRIRALAAAVDPTLRLSTPVRLDEVIDSSRWVMGFWLRSMIVLTAIALLLSLAGIYAVLSFTVARRTREIGVRVALGANPWHVVAAIFRRPVTQVCLGVVAGTALIGAASFIEGDGAMAGDGLTPIRTAALIGYAALMFGVCLLACIVPTRRALRVEPTQALGAE